MSCFDAEMRASALRRLEVERELRDAIEREEMILHYQPVVSLRSGEVASLEALLRWQHPERGLLDPADFVTRRRGQRPDRAGWTLGAGARLPADP